MNTEDPRQGRPQYNLLIPADSFILMSVAVFLAGMVTGFSFARMWEMLP